MARIANNNKQAVRRAALARYTAPSPEGYRSLANAAGNASSGGGRAAGLVAPSRPDQYSGSTATAPSPAPPPTVPQDPVYNNQISGALTTYNDTTNALRNGLQSAALAYGDPAAMSAVGLPASPNPVGAIELAAQRASQQSNNDELKRTASGTALSSLAARDANVIGRGQANADLAAQERFNAAVGKYNTGVGTARDTYNTTTGDALANEVKEGVTKLPTITPVGTSNVFGTSGTATPSSNSSALNSILKNVKLT